MNHNSWTVVLLIALAQCVFLLLVFLRRKANPKSRAMLLTMLAIILCTTISNIWSSAFLYRDYPQIAGFARGMVLLLGPALYLYVLSLTNPEFSFRREHLLHLLPYLTAIIIIRAQNSSLTYSVFISNIDLLMEGRAPVSGTTVLWFIAYSLQLSIYLLLARRKIALLVKDKMGNYLVPFDHRKGWLTKLSLAFVLVVVVFVLHSLSIFINGTVGVLTNYIYNMVLAFIVYMISYQAIADNRVLAPGFEVKYKSNGLKKQVSEGLVQKLLTLFEKEKVYTDPDLTLALLAQRTGVHSNLVSQTINQQFNKSFSELINHYRILEFKNRVKESAHLTYSIIGLAYESGYKSKSSFNTAFKKEMGITPSEYLKTLDDVS